MATRMRELARAFLTNAGHVVTLACDGAEALGARRRVTVRLASHEDYESTR
jgi:hypothetical protein